MIIPKTKKTTNEWVLKDIKDYFWSYATKDIIWIVALLLVMAFFVKNALQDFIPSSTFERLVAIALISFLFIILIPGTSLARYRKLVRTIGEKWATEEEREILRKDFAESVSVFDGAMRIGKKYSFIVKELRIVNTHDISFFSTKRILSRYAPLQVYAAMDYGKEIAICDFSDSSKAKNTANEWIAVARHILDFKKSTGVKDIINEELKKAAIKEEFETMKKEIIRRGVFLLFIIGITIGISIYYDSNYNNMWFIICGILCATLVAITLVEKYSEYKEIKKRL